MAKGEKNSDRRRFLAAAASTAMVAIAGCAGGSPDPDPTPSPPGGGDPPFCGSSAGAESEVSGDGLERIGGGTCSSVTVESGVTYYDSPDGPVELDLYRPEGASDAPAVVMVHGGGWRDGGRETLATQAKQLASRGFACACVDYRLPPTASYPAPVRDVVAGVRWLRSNAGEYGVDPGRIATYGVSAGAHLAALVGVAPGVSRFEPPGTDASVSRQVQAVVGVSGAYDLRAISDAAVRAGLASFMGGTPEEIPATYREASPVTHVSGDDPPVQLLHGTADEYLPYSQTTAFRDALRSAGVATDLYAASDGGHSFFTSDAHAPEVDVRVAGFLERRL